MTISRADLPEKLFYKIGEVTILVGVKQHVLRFWESEFPTSIRPQKSKTNQRLYRRKDVEAILAIKHLLYDLKYTIEGARKHLKATGVVASLPEPAPEALVDAAVKQTKESMRDDAARARKQAMTYYEKQLLDLQREVRVFIRDFGGGVS